MIFKYLKYFTLIIGLSSCKKCQDCKQQAIQGDIVSLYNLPSCLDGSIPQDEYYIRDTASFIAFVKTYPNYNSNCDTSLSTINIDFSKYILLGKYLSNGGCDAKYIRKVIIDNENKKVKYSIYSCSKGSCLKKIGSYNLVLVPKFPNNYEISFETKKY